MKRYLPFATIAAVLFLAIGAVALMFYSARRQTSTSSTLGAKSDSPQGGGAASSFVTLVEFGDYQCPPCGTLHPEIKKIKAEYGERVRFVFHHFPLINIHPNALGAALAASAASLQKRFLEMHDLLYKNQAEWSREKDPRPMFIDYARQLGLDVNRFVRDMEGTQARSLVANDIQYAQSVGVDSTPTVYIDGRLIPNESLSLEGLRREINRGLGVTSAPIHRLPLGTSVSLGRVLLLCKSGNYFLHCVASLT